jgi:hypothetical protein
MSNGRTHHIVDDADDDMMMSVTLTSSTRCRCMRDHCQKVRWLFYADEKY